MIMETTTKYDTIINFFLDNWIIATIVVAAVVIGFIPSLREGVLILFGKNRRKNKDIGDKIDTQLLRLLIKADEAIRKENQVIICMVVALHLMMCMLYLIIWLDLKLGTRRIKMPKLL